MTRPTVATETSIPQLCELTCEPWSPVDASIGLKGFQDALFERFTGATRSLVDLASLSVPTEVTRA